MGFGIVESRSLCSLSPPLFVVDGGDGGGGCGGEGVSTSDRAREREIHVKSSSYSPPHLSQRVPA